MFAPEDENLEVEFRERGVCVLVPCLTCQLSNRLQIHCRQIAAMYNKQATPGAVMSRDGSGYIFHVSCPDCASSGNNKPRAVLIDHAEIGQWAVKYFTQGKVR